MSLKKPTTTFIRNCSEVIERLVDEINKADAIVIGAGAGLSTAAGLDYDGARFKEYFGDFISKYHLTDMYTAGFYPYPSLEEKWAFWSRHIYYNRYNFSKRQVYSDLLNIMAGRDYFVLTTNVDHQFQLHGFDKHRLFYTQGDMGLWQCSVPCHKSTYDNEDAVLKMMREQYELKIPSALIPYCPKCGAPMEMNLRCDDTFIEDFGWFAAQNRYQDFINKHYNAHVLYLEIGVGMNTPGVIKYPFWRMTYQNPNAVYACINLNQEYRPKEIEKQSIIIHSSIENTLQQILVAVTN